MREVVLIVLLVIGLSPCFSQPGGGNGGGGGCSGPNPPAWCNDCNGPNPPPSCGAVPIDSAIWVLLIGGALMGGYYYYRNYAHN